MTPHLDEGSRASTADMLRLFCEAHEIPLTRAQVGLFVDMLEASRLLGMYSTAEHLLRCPTMLSLLGDSPAVDRVGNYLVSVCKHAVDLSVGIVPGNGEIPDGMAEDQLAARAPWLGIIGKLKRLLGEGDQG